MRLLRLSRCAIDLETGALEGAPGKLTPRELDLARYLSERPDTAVGRDEVLGLFGYVPTAVSRAVDKAMNSLREKVEVDSSNPDHFHTIRGVGYKFVPLSTEPPPLRPELEPFVGRQSELALCAAHLEQSGLVTLIGPAGVGKTRLAFASADRYACKTRQSVAGAELAAARTIDDFALAVARSLGLTLLGGAAAAQQIDAALGSRAVGLLLLDNLEHLLEHVDWIRRWRAAAPQLRLLCTSRVALGLPGEQVVRLGPLEPTDAVELLSIRASARGYPVTDTASLEVLARRLDGLPLALELAASRFGTLTPSQMLASLAVRRFEVLRGLAAALDHSWDLLDDDERTALAYLSVFVGTFSMEAAEGVLPFGGQRTLDLLSRLIDSSLLMRSVHRKEVRFHLLESVREYAAAKLGALGEEASAAAMWAHARHYASLGREDALFALRGHGGEALRYGRELDRFDMLVACRHAISVGDVEGAVQICAAVTAVFSFCGPIDQSEGLCREILAMPLSSAQRLRVGTDLGRVLIHRKPNEAKLLFEEIWRDAEELRVPAAAYMATANLVYLDFRSGQTDRARDRFERVRWAHGQPEVQWDFGLLEATLAAAEQRWRDSALMFERLALEAAARGDVTGQAEAIRRRGWACLQDGDIELAQRLFEQAAQAFEGAGHRSSRLDAQYGLAEVARARGAQAEAATRFQAVAEGFRAVGLSSRCVHALLEAARTLAGIGRAEEAMAAAEDALRLVRLDGAPSQLLDALLGLGQISRSCGRGATAIRILEEAATFVAQTPELGARTEQVCQALAEARGSEP